jgi:O-methyltransferase involved in polyketide biosynthesis
VTVYLDREVVEDTLRKIASTAHGSLVAFDYFTTEALGSRALYWRYGRAATKAAGETLKFGVDSTPPCRERLAELLRSCGLSLSDQRTLGEDTRTRRAWSLCIPSLCHNAIRAARNSARCSSARSTRLANTTTTSSKATSITGH